MMSSDLVQVIPTTLLHDLLIVTVQMLDVEDKDTLYLLYPAISSICSKAKTTSPAMFHELRTVLQSLRLNENGHISGLLYSRMIEPILGLLLDNMLHDKLEIRVEVVGALGTKNLL